MTSTRWPALESHESQHICTNGDIYTALTPRVTCKISRVCAAQTHTHTHASLYEMTSPLRRLEVLQSQIVAEAVLLRAVHHIGLAVPQTLHSMKDVYHILPLYHFTHNTDGTEHPTAAAPVQAVYNSASIAFLTFLLPFIHLEDQLEERALGGGNLPMTRPSQVLELTDHQVTLLRPGQVAYPEETTNDITVHRAGYAVHLYRTVS